VLFPTIISVCTFPTAGFSDVTEKASVDILVAQECLLAFLIFGKTQNVNVPVNGRTSATHKHPLHNNKMFEKYRGAL